MGEYGLYQRVFGRCEFSQGAGHVFGLFIVGCQSVVEIVLESFRIAQVDGRQPELQLRSLIIGEKLLPDVLSECGGSYLYQPFFPIRFQAVNDDFRSG